MNRRLILGLIAALALFHGGAHAEPAASAARGAAARISAKAPRPTAPARYKHKAYVFLDMDDTVGDTSEMNRRVMTSLGSELMGVQLTPVQQQEIKAGLNEREQYDYMKRLSESSAAPRVDPVQRLGARRPSFDTWLRKKRSIEAAITTEPAIATLLPHAEDLIRFAHQHPDVTLGFASNRNGKVLGNMIRVLGIDHLVAPTHRVGAADLKDEHGQRGDRLKPHPDAIVLLMKKVGIDLAKVKTQADFEAMRDLRVFYGGDAYSDYVAVNNTNAFVRDHLRQRGLTVPDDFDLVRPFIVQTGHISDANRQKLPAPVLVENLGDLLAHVKTVLQ